jgi:hypothetical protein
MRERRHLLLLISILVLFMLSPFVVTFRHGVLFLNVFGAAILVAGSYALSERKQLFRTAVVLSATSIVATCLLLAFPQHWAVLVSHSSIILLVAFFLRVDPRLCATQWSSDLGQDLCRHLRVSVTRICVDLRLRAS